MNSSVKTSSTVPNGFDLGYTVQQPRVIKGATGEPHIRLVNLKKYVGPANTYSVYFPLTDIEMHGDGFNSNFASVGLVSARSLKVCGRE